MGIGWLLFVGLCNVCGVCWFVFLLMWVERFVFVKVVVVIGDNLVLMDLWFKVFFFLIIIIVIVIIIMKIVMFIVMVIVIVEEFEIENVNNNKIML